MVDRKTYERIDKIGEEMNLPVSQVAKMAMEDFLENDVEANPKALTYLTHKKEKNERADS